MNRIAEALKAAVQRDDATEIRHLLRENLGAIVKALETVDEVNAAVLKTIFNVQPTDAYAPRAMINRVELAHECFNLENPDG